MKRKRKVKNPFHVVKMYSARGRCWMVKDDNEPPAAEVIVRFTSYRTKAAAQIVADKKYQELLEVS